MLCFCTHRLEDAVGVFLEEKANRRYRDTMGQNMESIAVEGVLVALRSARWCDVACSHDSRREVRGTVIHCEW